ncbi:hypothetical protein MLD38_011674 [Melastoma candidum]|uniref:Uncharacterized protein n=1 Tax=Melastoma candidum TaxID=119954 RepID=A0ACB9R3T2_9MYRT|nr:hypothetical protein MLD38_011674 [Melastoma candidum]
MTTALTLSWGSSSFLPSLPGCGGNYSLEVLWKVTGSFPIVAQKKTKKTRKVILKEDVEFVGKKGQLLDVRAGYFRNFLLPTGKAQIVTTALLKFYLRISASAISLGSWLNQAIMGFEWVVEEEKIEAEKKRVKEEAQQLALIFETVGAFKLKRKGGKGKQIFGREVDKRVVTVPEIREVGEYSVELKLHPGVSARIRLIVPSN